MRKYIQLGTLILLLVGLSSHVGSPGVIFEGNLGEYRIMVNVNPPDVIPGTATLTVVFQDAPQGLQLEAKPVYWSAGLNGTPKSDPLLAVPDEPGKYEAELWFMNSGTSSISLSLKNGNQTEEVIIPIMAMPTAQKEMDANLGILLAGLGIFLVILMVTIIASAMGDSLSEPGTGVSKKLKRKKTVGIVVGSAVIFLLLWGGKTWWDAEAAGYQEILYKPFSATSTVIDKEDVPYLHLKIDSTVLKNFYITRKLSYLVPDHGKLMHLFLIREGDLDVFAHLHPKRLDTLNFQSKLPPLPAGNYFVFADITRYTGFSETIVSNLEIKDEPSFRLANLNEGGFDRDDTYTFSNPVQNKVSNLLDTEVMICGKPGQKTDLPGGYSAIWENPESKFRAGKMYALDFALFDEMGQPAQLEPYLGMMGHAVVLKHDGTVYIHLHPTGNYSMASQQVLVDRFKSGKVGFENLPEKLSFADSVDQVIAFLDQLPDESRDSLLMGNMDHTPLVTNDPEHDAHSMVRFPYAFPEPGDYRVWIQVKIDGKIINGAFDVNVES
ncbi:hypothetical protein [Pararhodonellum marinum]|uniref:hypothetical protein n=1 Tax=Pararhodonellum marinum TaxID=2755358 RepID=UPI00188F294D|nr:hypothetical protein [Pararhodonellum marinum]